MQLQQHSHQQQSQQQQSQQPQLRANISSSSRQRAYKTSSLTPGHHQMPHHIEETVAEVVDQSAAYYRASNLSENAPNDTSWDDDEDIEDEDLMEDSLLHNNNNRSIMSGINSPVSLKYY